MAKADALSRFHELIVETARDGFAQIEAEGLGEQLRERVDALLDSVPESDAVHTELRHLRGGLEAFEARGRVDRGRIVGHALRISATLRSRAAAKSKAKAKAPPSRGTSPTQGSSRSDLPYRGLRSFSTQQVGQFY